MKFIILTVATYLIASINFPIILFNLLGKGDPREHFSGNPGVTNVYRQAGMIWAVLVLLLDVGRAVGVALVAVFMLDKHLVPWIGLALIIGNRYPVFHRFQGGKGVANFLGFTVCLSPLMAAASCVVWVVIWGVIREPFIASFFMIAICTIGQVVYGGVHASTILGALATCLFVFYNHRDNVSRYMIRKREGKSIPE